MNKKGLIIASSLLSLGAVAIAVTAGFKLRDFGAFATQPEPNAEYTIATWEYDGWCKNAGIVGDGEEGRVFMFHSTSNGAGQGVIVRDDVKLAIILTQRDYMDSVTGAVDYTVINGMPSILCDENLGYSGNDHVWPAEYLAIYRVRVMIGDFTFTGDSDDGALTENKNFDNFVLKSFVINATLTYCDPGDDPAGNWERYDHEYPATFTNIQTEIGNYEGQGYQPHVGFKVNSIIVTYGCAY